MGFRYRQSIKIAPGVRVNIGKKSVGLSVGTKGFRKSINSSGRVTTTIGIPGTGISYVDSKNINPKSKTTTNSYNESYSENNFCSSEYSETSQPQKKPKVQVFFEDRPTIAYIGMGIILLLIAYFFIDIFIPISILLAFCGGYYFYLYWQFKKYPNNPKYITDEQIKCWGNLIDSNAQTAHDLEKDSIPILEELKSRTENYYNELCYASSVNKIKKCSELLITTQNKLVDLSEFIVLKGDEPKKDLAKYSSFINELK